MPRPFVRVTANGGDVTGNILPSLLEMTITDGSGQDSDSVSFVLDDQDGIIAPPKKGAELGVTAGFEDDHRNFGTFIVDQVSLNGWPQTMSVTARSVDALSSAKQRRDESYDKKSYATYQDIFQKVADRMGLSAVISSEIGGKPVEFEAQFGESDLAFSSRLGDKLNAAVTVKEQRLIIVPRGAGLSAGGSAMPPILITRPGNAISYNVTTVNGPKHGSVKAIWFDREAAENKEVVVSASDEGPEFLLRQNFQNSDDARETAKAQADALKRGEGTASFTIEGNPHARAEAHVIVAGVRSLVDGTWRAKSVSHKFSGNGPYTTDVRCEVLNNA